MLMNFLFHFSFCLLAGFDGENLIVILCCSQMVGLFCSVIKTGSLTEWKLKVVGLIQP